VDTVCTIQCEITSNTGGLSTLMGSLRTRPDFAVNREGEDLRLFCVFCGLGVYRMGFSKTVLKGFLGFSSLSPPSTGHSFLISYTIYSSSNSIQVTPGP
jgi:hypothetical protein